MGCSRALWGVDGCCEVLLLLLLLVFSLLCMECLNYCLRCCCGELFVKNQQKISQKPYTRINSPKTPKTPQKHQKPPETIKTPKSPHSPKTPLKLPLLPHPPGMHGFPLEDLPPGLFVVGVVDVDDVVHVPLTQVVILPPPPCRGGGGVESF